MSGDYATLLLGAQEGGGHDFARLYELTNPPLVRYLRVVSDVDPANLALTTWTTLLRRLPSCPAEENAWLELVIGVARLAVEDSRQREGWSHLVDPTAHLPYPALAELEATGATTGATTSGDAAPAAVVGSTEAEPATTDAEATVEATDDDPQEGADGVDRTIAALRARPAEEADLLAMRATAWLNREAISRLTGRDASTVRTQLDQALEHLGLPLFVLVKALRAPARPEELVDLPVVLHLFQSGAAHRPPAVVATTTASMAATAAIGEPSVVKLLDTPAPAPATRAARHSSRTAAGGGSHVGWVGVTAAAAVVTIGGLGAAAWTGLLPDPFGRHATPRPPTAGGPAHSPPAGGGTANPQQPTGPRPGTPGAPPSSTGRVAVTTGGGSGSVSLGRLELAVQVVPVNQLPPSPSSVTPPGVTPTPRTTSNPPPVVGPSGPPASKPPASKPPSSKPPASRPDPPPRAVHSHPRPHPHPNAGNGKAKGHAKAGKPSDGAHGKGHAYAYGKDHAKHSTSQGLAKGHDSQAEHQDARRGGPSRD